MPSGPARGGIERSRELLERAVGQELPFDDNVLGYLVKAASASDYQEVLDLVCDFCPRWHEQNQASLARHLIEVEESAASSAPRPGGVGGGRAHVSGGAPRAAGWAPAAPEVQQKADHMLTQLLQEEEEADVSLGGQSQARAAKKGKKGFQKLSIDYNIGRGATPAQLGTAAPGGLAEMLRARRQQEQRPLQTQLQSDHFGPPAQRSSWAPSPQDFAAAALSNGASWAERAHAVAQAPAPEVRAAGASLVDRLAGLQLKLKTAAGAEYKVNADGGECIGDVKARLEKTHGIPAGSQRIILLGRELPDAQELLAAGIRDGQSLQLALREGAAAPHGPARPRGSGVAPPPPPGPPPNVRASAENASRAAAVREGGELTLRLKLPAGVQATVKGLPAWATVAMLKRRIQEEHGIRSDHLAMSFFGVPLEQDEQRLSDCGVATGATVEAALRPPGARPAAAGDRPVLSADDPQGPRRKQKGQAQEVDRFASLQTSGHNRIMSEQEALELALAASAQEAGQPGASSAGPDGRCSEGGDLESSGDELGEGGGGEAAGGTRFHVEVGLQDAKLAPLVAHAQRVASVQFQQDLIGRVSKRSGLRLTLLSEGGKKVKTVLGYTVYRFRPRVMVVLQVGVASEHRGQGCRKQLAKWLVRHAKQASMEMVLVNSPREMVQFYQQCGFRPRPAGDAEQDEDFAEGQVMLEYRLRKPAPKAPKVPAASASMSRAGLSRKLFELCDLDGDGALSAQEMERFARLTGFDGPSEEWESEYKELCADNSRSVAQGVDAPLLLQLVDDDSDKGCYCTDDELREMVATLEAEARARAPAASSVPASAPPPRIDLISAVFQACDRDRDRRLNLQELRAFATQTGFEGDDAEWEEEYLLLCPEGGGVSFDRFVELVNDESDDGCHCTDEELRDMLPVLRAAAAAAAPAPPAPPPREEQRSVPPRGGAPQQTEREAMVREVFRLCDLDGDGFLAQAEMCAFARETGFDGSDQDWQEEYGALCEEHGQDPAVGVPVELLARLVDDDSDNGCHCTDSELKEMLERLSRRSPGERQQPPEPPRPAAAPPPPAREERPAAAPPPATADAHAEQRRILVHRLFEACDADQDGHLRETEMRTFARLTDFPGTDEEWEQEYVQLCSDRGVDPDRGFDEEAFRDLVNDESDDGQHCTDEELAEMTARVLAQQAAPPARAGPAAAVAAPAPDRGPRQEPDAAPAISKPPGLATPEGSPQWGPHAGPRQDHEGPILEAAPPLDQDEEAWEKVGAVGSRQDGWEEVGVGSPGASSGAPCQGAERHPELPRRQLVASVFRACDLNGDGRLSCVEMEAFARQTGFEGTAEEWAAEFRALCADHHAGPNEGINLDVFAELVDDESDNGCYCTDGELVDMLKKLFPALKEVTAAAPPPAATPDGSARTQLIGDVFRACDRDGDGRLSSSEMRPVAELIGFEGDDATWEAEFALLLQGHAGPGIGLGLFSQLVNDMSEDGCYCTDEELGVLLRRL